MNFTTIIENRLNKLMDNLSKDFELTKFSKSPSRFNSAKLDWFNREFIKMMSLEEFAWRSSSLKLQNSLNFSKKESQNKITKETKEMENIDQNENNSDKPFRIGDYVFLVDLDKSKIFGHISKSSNFATNFFYPVGGGRENGLNSIENLQKELREELNGQIKIDESKLLKMPSFRIEYEMKDYFGVEFNLYFYPIDFDKIQNCNETENEIINKFEWFDLQEVISGGKMINYPIWQNFCTQNNLKCFEPNLQILQQYLAWNLDKNRVTKLSEVG